MEGNNNKGMKNEGQNTSVTLRVNKNKVPSILVNNITKCEHEKNKKQVKFHKTQNPKPNPLTLRKPTPQALTATKLSPGIIPPKRAKKQIMRTASWSAGSTEHTKKSGKTIKELEIIKTNTNNSKSKGPIMINKPQKARRNSLQSSPNTNNEKQNKEKNTLQVKTRSSRSRSKSPNVPGKKTNEKAPSCIAKKPPEEKPLEHEKKSDTGLASLISEKLQKFDELRGPKSLTRRKSLESLGDTVTQNIKVIAHFMPRRRFSQGAVSALKEVLANIDENDLENADDDEIDNVDPEDFAQLTREEQLKILEGKSWTKNIDFNPSSSDLNSLTGGKKAKWKFQDSFYGNFNVGRRPSQDTAWGRRFGLDILKPTKLSIF